MPYSLSFLDRYLRIAESKVISDTSQSQQFYFIPDNEEAKIVTKWTGKQWHKLLSCIETGADLMFPDEANEIIWQFIKTLVLPPEIEEESDCINYLPSAAFVSFSPQNPYSQPDFVPEGYLVAPFHYNSDFLYPELFGFLATDVMVATDSIPIFGDWGDLLGLNFPTIKLRVQGEGQIELDLISIQLGGYAIVKVGSPPNIIDIIDGIIDTGVLVIDLQADVESIPIESDLIIEQEIPIDSIEPIDVYIVFVPKISASLDFFGMGGGIRQIGLCGLELASEDTELEDIRFNTLNCSFEKRVGGGEWEIIVGGDEWLLCVEALLATQSEITEAVVDAAEIISSRFLAGIAGNVESGITINPDGTIDVDTDGIPPDDPLTIGYDEAAAAFYGGAVGLVSALKLFYDKIDNYYGSTNGTPINAASFTKFQIKIYFPCDDATMDIAIDDYYAYRATNGRHVFTPVAATYQYIYCAGANEQAWARWLSDNPLSYPITKVTQMHLLSTALADSFWTDYFNTGSQVPSTGYREAACTPVATEEFQLDMSTANNPQYTTTQQAKTGHRYLIEIEGTFQDSDNLDVIGDGMYFKTISTGVVTFSPTIFNFSGFTAPTQAQVPYQSNGKYAFTLDKTATAAGIVSRDNGAGMAIPNVTGILSYRITDLGQYTV